MLSESQVLLRDHIKGKSDDEILDYARNDGSVENFLDATFAQAESALDPGAAQDCVFGYEITDGTRTFHYRVAILGGTLTYEKRPATDGRATLVLSTPNYLRLITGQLDGFKAYMTGRMKIRGNLMFAARIPKMFGM